MKIDLVYTWVDDSDPEWLKGYQHWADFYHIENITTDIDSRYRDNGELRYSLRSAQMNAPWVNHIYIVTAGQVPKWLDTSHPKITIVDHKEILPSEALPTYNSGAIETALDNIPGLCEHFLFANDDMFFMNPVTPEYFFDDNQNPYVRFCRIGIKKETLLTNSYYYKIRNTFNLYSSKFRIAPFFKFYVISHQIDPFRKSYITDCKSVFKNEFEKTALLKFRHPKSVHRTIYGYYMADQKGCIIREMPNIKETLAFRQSEMLNISMETFDFVYKRGYIKNGYPKLMCLNDTEHVKDKDREMVSKQLEMFFPQKAEWEID